MPVPANTVVVTESEADLVVLFSAITPVPLAVTVSEIVASTDPVTGGLVQFGASVSGSGQVRCGSDADRPRVREGVVGAVCERHA